MKQYEGFWHSLTAGELPENIDRVYSDIFAWCVGLCVCVCLRCCGLG